MPAGSLIAFFVYIASMILHFSSVTVLYARMLKSPTNAGHSMGWRIAALCSLAFVTYSEYEREKLAEDQRGLVSGEEAREEGKRERERRNGNTFQWIIDFIFNSGHKLVLSGFSKNSFAILKFHSSPKGRVNEID